ncbi:MAG: PAS domain S-box protein [Bacteroidota bacterium]
MAIGKKTYELNYLNELFQSIQKTAKIGVWELNITTNEVYSSDLVIEIHELPKGSELNLADGLDYYHPDYRPIIEEAIDKAIAQQEAYDLELILITAKGNHRWVRAIGFPVLDGDKVIALRGMFQDIHQKKRLEVKEKTSRETLELFVAHTPAAVAMLDTNLHYLMASNRWYTDYELEGQDIIGKHHYDVFPEIRKMPHWIKDHQDVLKGKVIRNNEDPFIREDGTKQWLKYEIYPWYNSLGEIGGIGMFTEDITEDKIMIEKVRKSEERLNSVFQNSSIGMTVVSTDGRFLDVNPSLVKMLGYTKEEFLHLTFQEVTHPDDLKEDMDKVQAMIDRKIDTYEMEKRYFHKEGQTIWGQLNVSASYNEKGEVDFFISQIQDITLRKNIEEERAKIQETLEQEVQKRTVELEATNKELEAFSYSVSHDLRAPLRSINGFSGAIIEDYSHLLDQEGKSYLNRISGAAERMGSLIDDLLDLSRISRRQLVRQELDMTLLTQEVVKSLNVPEHFEIDVEPNLKLNGDPKLIRIALENLLGNAIKYSGKIENPQIKVSGLKEGDRTIIQIRDNGVGFDMNYAAKLFGAFQRLHARSEYEGTGIGLATVQRIINLHGGRVWAKSKPGEGATFYFTTKSSYE